MKIKSFLIAVIGSLVLAVGTMAAFVAYGYARSTASNILYGDLASLADAISSYIAADIEKEMAVLEALAYTDALTSNRMTLEEKAQYLVHYRDLDPVRVAYTAVDVQGDGVTTDGIRVNVADRDYFKRVMQGKSVVTEPIENRAIPGMFIFVYAVPIYDRQTGAIAGALVLDMNASYISEMLAEIPIGQGGPYIINNETGNTVGHYFGYANMIENVESAAAADSSLNELAAIHALARAGESGVRQYTFAGDAYLSAYVQLPSEHCDWTVACNALISEFMADTLAMLNAIIIMVAFLSSMGVIAAIRIASSIGKPISVISDSLEGIAQGGGDLTVRLEEKGNNEIAAISVNFNKFIGTLRGMIANISESAESMENVAQTLQDEASSISGDVSSIAKDIENLNFSVEEQSASVTETSAIVTQVARNIEGLTRQIESQSSAVTQSSASIQQMAANIGAISENASKAQGEFDELKGNAASGKESITAVQELVTKLTAQSDSLLEANNVIDNIANQTNLLAMNAAIEAAHAGEAGKGFAVVAEEIRALAEDSASQSRAIAEGLKATIESIRNIASATNVADSAFDSVAAKIESVTGLVSEINLAMVEQATGSRQVLEALQDIEGGTTQIRDGSVEMNSGAETILKEINRLISISQSVQERSTSIANAAEAISGAVEGIVRNTGSNKEAIDVLSEVTGKFVL